MHIQRGRMGGWQTPTAVNIVLLKNRTLVSVFERVVVSEGSGRADFLALPVFVYAPGPGLEARFGFQRAI